MSVVPSAVPAMLTHENIHTKLVMQNVVASCRITPDGTTVNLSQLVQQSRNAEYNPKRFSAVIMRLIDPKSTALVFESGKMVVLGAKSENSAKVAARKFAKIIKLCNVAEKVWFQDWKVNNLVATVDCGFPIRLEGLHLAHAKFSSYEPELFPGLIYRLTQPKVVLLVFVSGKVVLTGAKSGADLSRAIKDLFPVIFEHRKDLLSSLPRPNAE